MLRESSVISRKSTVNIKSFTFGFRDVVDDGSTYMSLYTCNHSVQTYESNSNQWNVSKQLGAESYLHNNNNNNDNYNNTTANHTSRGEKSTFWPINEI